MAKAKKKAKKATKATAPKAKAKSKAKPKAKAKAKAKAKPAAKAKAKANVKAKAKPAKAKPAPKATPATTNGAPAASTTGGASMAPFQLAETEPGKYSLVLTEFEPAGSVFAAAKLDGGGYAWEGIAKHVTEVLAPDLADRFGLDPEASMFCAYGEDRAALERLGAELARLFHDASALAAVIQQIGPDGFDD